MAAAGLAVEKVQRPGLKLRVCAEAGVGFTACVVDWAMNTTTCGVLPICCDNSVALCLLAGQGCERSHLRRLLKDDRHRLRCSQSPGVIHADIYCKKVHLLPFGGARHAGRWRNWHMSFEGFLAYDRKYLLYRPISLTGHMAWVGLSVINSCWQVLHTQLQRDCCWRLDRQCAAYCCYCVLHTASAGCAVR